MQNYVCSEQLFDDFEPQNEPYFVKLAWQKGGKYLESFFAFLRIFCAILLCYDIILLLNVLGFYKIL